MSQIFDPTCSVSDQTSHLGTNTCGLEVKELPWKIYYRELCMTLRRCVRSIQPTELISHHGIN